MGAFIIAEVGVNHNGDLAIARELIARSSEAGCDAVKFQTFKATDLVTADCQKTPYQVRNDGDGTQLQMLRRLELDAAQHLKLAELCTQYGIEFMSTAFGIAELDLLVSVGIKRVKVASGELTNLPYLRAAASKGLPLLVSTGMATLADIEVAIAELEMAGCPHDAITLLHCTSLYPAPYETVHLRAMDTLRQAFNLSVGYSDHTLGQAVAIAAVARGACVIEKHVTLDRHLPGPDHQASLEPHELLSLVTAIRATEVALGDVRKRPTDSERQTALMARRSIVASRPIREGEIFSADNLACKRPGTGISPMQWDQLIGKTSSRDYQPDDMIGWS